MNTSPVFTVLISLASSGVLVALVNVWFQRKNIDATQAKTKAEEARILSEGALAEVIFIRKQLADVRTTFAEHRKWDREMVREVRRLNPEAEIADPPEVFV